MISNEDKKRIRLELVKAAKEICTNTELTAEDIDMLITALQDVPETSPLVWDPNKMIIQPYNHPETQPWPGQQIIYTNTPIPVDPTKVTCSTAKQGCTNE